MTQQFADHLYYKKEKHSVRGGLSPFGGIEDKDYPVFEVNCSACWRGYIATWEIDDEDWLRLVKIKASAMIINDRRIMSENFLYQVYQGHDSPVTATWVSGELEVAYGEVIGSCGQYNPVHESYKVLRFESGKLIVVNNYDSDWWRKKNDCESLENAFNSFLKHS